MHKALAWFLDQLQRWQAGYTAWDYIKPLLVPGATSGIATYLAMLEHLPAWQVFLVAVYAVPGGTLLLLAWKRARPYGDVRLKPEQRRIRLLERYYVALALLADDIDRMVRLDKETGKDSSYFQIENAVDKIRQELMDMAPSVWPVSVAMDFQKAGLVSIDPKERVPHAVRSLMKKVHRHWGVYAEGSGLAPLKFKDSPIVKIDNL